MGLGSVWRRGRNGSTAGDGEWAAAEYDLWQWFPEELAWRLFVLPVDGFFVLSSREGVRFGYFQRTGDRLRGELEAATGFREQFEVRWPARFEEFERLAERVAAALRAEFGLRLPIEAAAAAWVDGDEQIDCGPLGYAFPPETLRTLSPADALRMVQLGRESLAADKDVAASDQELRLIAGEDYLEQHGIDILTRPGPGRPVRERTVDFIGMDGPDCLAVLDVFLDLDGENKLPRRIRREFNGHTLEQGNPDYTLAMIHHDPDMRAILQRHPELAEALSQGRIRVDYALMIVDSGKRMRFHDFTATPEPDRPAAAPQQVPELRPESGSAAAPSLPFDPYPLLQPVDWPHRNLIPNWPSASGNAPIIVLTADTGDGYAMQSYDPAAPGNDFLLPAAIARLSSLQRYPWETDELYGLPVANCSGHDFAAEKVLDPRAMQDAHHLLDSPRLWVSTPRRTCLTAVPYELDERQLMVFQRLVTLTYEDDSYGNAPITPGAYLVENGRIIDFVEDVNLLGVG
ncbi:hypothetical protein [Nocardia huaxiensis]|uniref:Uncharacterized protein n=1 Tax=Nocardia huaxiensis TaxID=2755382 RepID=A0A7D6ZE41_9NOCA|nr:hypothetical protein [Nocardia huaxiensis]QLY33368.1 hypothetical protein H0264_15040 [Nocardia huaxiensis]UFS99720.1 hypothetical protein LPY97_18490 [Nocardia huaxiensis]